MTASSLVPFQSLYLEPSRNGLTRPKRVRGDGYKMINMGELFAHDRIKNPPMDLVPMSDSEINRFGIRGGDLLFARQSLVAEGAGKCSIVLAAPEVTTFESHLIRVRLNPKVAEPLYFYYYFSSHAGKGNVQSLVMQVAAAGIRGSELATLLVPKPDVTTQRRIASILSAYDDLIENNTRRIAILEEMARRIYEEWFVRFRFPGHENVRMVESEMGLVPEGWRNVAASEAMEINQKIKVPKEGLKPFLAMNCLSDSAMLIDDHSVRSGNSGSKFQNGDTLFARITPCLENGKTGFVQLLPTVDAVAFGSTEFIVLRSRTLCPEFVYLLARSGSFRDNAIKSMSGASGRQRVREACFDTFQLVQPDQQVLAYFSEIVEPLFRLIHSLAKKNTNLRTTRDLLLPKLISGELDISALPEPEVAAFG